MGRLFRFFCLIDRVRYDKIKINRKKDFRMKRWIAVLSSLLVLPAYAEVRPVFYDETIDYMDEDTFPDDVSEVATETSAPTPVVPVKPTTVVSPRAATSGRSGASRAVSSNTNVSNRTTTSSRGVTARTATGTVAAPTVPASRTVTTSNTPTRGTVSRASVSRAATAGATAGQTTGTTKSGSVTSAASGNTATARRATNTGTTAARAATTSLVQTDTVSSPLYTGRVGVRTTAGVGSRQSTTVGGLGASTTVLSASDMDDLTELTEYCKAQYSNCMDNYCNVLDENQGRCSCSSNLKNYEKTEAALRQITLDLQDVAQKIQYIGLSKDEVESLFAQTEAELKMQSTTDTSQLKNDLDRIKSLIVDVNGGTATSSSNSSIGIDLSNLLDLDFANGVIDLSSFLGTNSSSISNQRGADLFKTAAARCKASVLNNCTAQGVDASIITNAYDLEIDKACLAYESSLTEANNQMTQTVKNAQNVLLKARLLVANQKNQYDLRGCVTELDNCMQDEFVCGTNYENCLDPTGRYIVNGQIVVGSTPGESGSNDTTFYKAVWSNDNGKTSIWNNSNVDLADYIEQTVKSNSMPTRSSSDMSGFLQYKIGYHDNSTDKNYGMCINVLNKCQNYTYTTVGSTKEYNPANNVVKEYLQRTMIQIKAAQDALLADYAEDCLTDVALCLSQNNYGTDSVSQNVAIKACNAVINTCMNVTGTDMGMKASFIETATNQKAATDDPYLQRCIIDIGTCVNNERPTSTKDSQTAAIEKCVNKYSVCKGSYGNTYTAAQWYKLVTGKDMATQ